MRSARRFCAVALLLGMISLMMLNAFFLKAALWVPSAHALNVWRLLLWYASAPYAMAEYYALVKAPCSGSSSGESVGIRRLDGLWRTVLCTVAIVLEAALCYKLREDTFTAPFPPTVLLVGAGVGASTLLWAASLYRRSGWDPSSKKYN